MADTRQLDSWRGKFGDSYIDRNSASEDRVRASTMMWERLFAPIAADSPRSILEVGANVGANLQAIKRLTDAELWAIEPNARARAHLVATGIMPDDHVFDAAGQSIPLGDKSIDLVFTCGVLIHIAPNELEQVCREIHRCARKYIACVEYFADQPEEKVYHGQSSLLFKRDFGSFWLDNFPDLIARDCGFNWRRTTGLDNSTWWVFEKT